MRLSVFVWMCLCVNIHWIHSTFKFLTKRIVHNLAKKKNSWEAVTLRGHLANIIGSLHEIKCLYVCFCMCCVYAHKREVKFIVILYFGYFALKSQIFISNGTAGRAEKKTLIRCCQPTKTIDVQNLWHKNIYYACKTKWIEWNFKSSNSWHSVYIWEIISKEHCQCHRLFRLIRATKLFNCLIRFEDAEEKSLPNWS